MALTSVGAIFATQSKLLQRVYIPQTDDFEIAQQHVGAGESIQNVSLSTYQAGGVVAVQAAIGTPTISGRCAVIDNTNTVVACIIADPAIYTDPNGHLVVPHDRADVGDTWNGTAVLAQFAEVSRTTGLVIATSTQDVLAPTPGTPGNLMVKMVGANAALLIGSSVPGLTAKIQAGGV